jgi:alpha-beta hydrolase superfamily lysophospholipase
MRQAFLLLWALGFSATAAMAVAAPHAIKLNGEELEFKTVDGWTLHGVWHKAVEGKPTIVLLHGTGQRKEDWRVFARAVAKSGLGFLAIDMRGHGESRTTPSGEVIIYKKLRATKGANDYEDMTRDAETAVAHLVGQGVAEETIGLAGAEVGSSIAVKYAAVHPKVPFLIMLSPGLAWQEIPLVNAVRAFKGRQTPILMVHSEADKRSSKETPLLFAFAKNAVGEENTRLMVIPDERGTRMFAKNKDLSARILSWIENPRIPEPSTSTDTVPTAAEEPAPGDAFLAPSAAQ